MNIRSHSELKAEIGRLVLKKQAQETAILSKAKGFADMLTPSQIVKNIFKSFVKDTNIKEQITSVGSDVTVGYLISNLLFRKASPLMKTVMTFAGTSLVNYFKGDESKQLIDRIRNLITRIRKHKEDDDDIHFNEQDIYRGDGG